MEIKYAGPTKDMLFDDAKIIFKNFRGVKDDFHKYATPGVRTFDVVLDNAELVGDLIKDGWNIKQFPQRNEDDPLEWHLQIKLNYSENSNPPEVVMINGRKKVQLTEDTVGNLDGVMITAADLIIRPYNWEVNGKKGVKGYLKKAYITIEEDPFADKYDFDD